MKIYVLLILSLIQVSIADENLFDLSIIHLNDFHAKFEPVSVWTGPCSSALNDEGLCYGGIARVVTAIRELREKLPNTLVLNAGDNYQGTLLYSLFKWNITLKFMNKIPFDATGLGNHEFDDGVEGAVPFIEGLKFPVVAANMDASLEPTLQGKFKRSIVVERGGRKIGIIGCITQFTNEMSRSGKLIFTEEKGPVSAEATRLREQGVDIIILLSHSGYDVDQRLALEVPEIDVIVGAHSHSFLYTGPAPSVEIPAGEYPTVVTQASGHKVLIVQAYAYTKYLGVLHLKFNNLGQVVSWSGNPMMLGKNVKEDPEIKLALKPWVDEANIQGAKAIGRTAVLLEHSTCYAGECNLGNLLTDAMVQMHVNVENNGHWTAAAIAIINPGGLRASIGETPNITFNHLVTSQPFQNTIDVIELQGKDIAEILEFSASKRARSYRDFSKGRGCMQVSGIQASYNMSNPDGRRLTSLMLRCSRCRIPTYHRVKMEEWYSVAMPSFLSNGGSGFNLIPQRGRNKQMGPLDVEVFSNYIKRQSPVVQGLEGRINILE